MLAGKADPYPRALAKHSGFSEEQVRPCAEELVTLHKNAPTGSLNAVYKKYSHAKWVLLFEAYLVCEGVNY